MNSEILNRGNDNMLKTTYLNPKVPDDIFVEPTYESTTTHSMIHRDPRNSVPQLEFFYPPKNFSHLLPTPRPLPQPQNLHGKSLLPDFENFELMQAKENPANSQPRVHMNEYLESMFAIEQPGGAMNALGDKNVHSGVEREPSKEINRSAMNSMHFNFGQMPEYPENQRIQKSIWVPTEHVRFIVGPNENVLKHLSKHGVDLKFVPERGSSENSASTNIFIEGPLSKVRNIESNLFCVVQNEIAIEKMKKAQQIESENLMHSERENLKGKMYGRDRAIMPPENWENSSRSPSRRAGTSQRARLYNDFPQGSQSRYDYEGYRHYKKHEDYNDYYNAHFDDYDDHYNPASRSADQRKRQDRGYARGDEKEAEYYENSRSLGRSKDYLSSKPRLYSQRSRRYAQEETSSSEDSYAHREKKRPSKTKSVSSSVFKSKGKSKSAGNGSLKEAEKDGEKRERTRKAGKRRKKPNTIKLERMESFSALSQHIKHHQIKSKPAAGGEHTEEVALVLESPPDDLFSQLVLKLSPDEQKRLASSLSNLPAGDPLIGLLGNDVMEKLCAKPAAQIEEEAAASGLAGDGEDLSGSDHGHPQYNSGHRSKRRRRDDQGLATGGDDSARREAVDGADADDQNKADKTEIFSDLSKISNFLSHFGNFENGTIPGLSYKDKDGLNEPARGLEANVAKNAGVEAAGGNQEAAGGKAGNMKMPALEPKNSILVGNSTAVENTNRTRKNVKFALEPEIINAADAQPEKEPGDADRFYTYSSEAEKTLEQKPLEQQLEVMANWLQQTKTFTSFVLKRIKEQAVAVIEKLINKDGVDKATAKHVGLAKKEKQFFAVLCQNLDNFEKNDFLEIKSIIKRYPGHLLYDLNRFKNFETDESSLHFGLNDNKKPKPLFKENSGKCCRCKIEDKVFYCNWCRNDFCKSCLGNVLKPPCKECQRSLSPIEKVVLYQSISFEKGRENMLATFEKSGELKETSFVLPLFDPFSFKRLECPVKGRSCAHRNVFDLASFVKRMSNKSSDKCPVCNKILTENDLEVDKFIERILVTESADVREVVILRDGSWINKAEQERRGRKLLSGDTSEEEAITYGKQKKAIDLTS